MSHWISKAANAFKGDDSSSFQAFELFCECGQKHTGLRRAKWQRIVCRDCGGSLFVLQRDAYPPPKEKPELRPSRAIVEDERPLVEEPVEEFEEPAPARSKKSRPRQPVVASDSRSKRTLPPIVSAPSLTPRKSQGGFWNPFWVIMAVIAILGAVTGFMRYQSSQRRLAERSLKTAIDKIRIALPRGEWVEARNQLEIAVAAHDRLGRQDADAVRYRQQLRETTAMTSLLSKPLNELLVEAGKAQAVGETELAEFQFQAKGQWLFVEGQAEPISDGQKSARVQHRIPLPITVGGENLPVEVVIVSTDLTRRLAKSESESVIVAIRIEAVQLSEDKTTWQILAQPESTVLWAFPQTYQGIGYTPEEAAQVAGVLASQSKSLGVTDDTTTE